MQAKQKPVVVVGSINIDLVANTSRIPVEGETVVGEDFQIHAGGKGANQAVAVARLGHPVRLIGRLGDDAFGSQLREQLEKAGVNIDGVKTTPGTSGVAIIIVAESGENIIVITPGANALVTPNDLDEEIEIIRSAGVVLAQLEIPIETVQHLADICAREGVPLILDPAPAKELPRDLMKSVAWFTPNETEATFYLGKWGTSSDRSDSAATAQMLLNNGVKGVLLKLGSRGSYLESSEDLGHEVPAFAVKAVDTTAAGDAFNGAFATGLLMGMEPLDSARFASAAAALSVTRSGAQPSMPDIAEVQELLSRNARG